MSDIRTRAYVEYRFPTQDYAVNLMIDGAICLPQETVMEATDGSTAYTDPWLTLPGEALHALYDAIGEALGKHACNFDVLTEALRIERQRVAKLLDHVVAGVSS